MQTVNFNCPHCGNLMAVGANLLGRNVRCPHCRQVVRAPAPAGEPLVQTPAPPVSVPPPPQQQMPTFEVPQQTEHHESIFGERHDEDVFGSEPPKPVMPSEPTPPAPLPSPHQLAETVSVSTFLPPPPLVPPPLPSPQAQYTAPAVAPLDFSPAAGGALEDHRPDVRPSATNERSDYGYRPRPAREEAPGTPAFAWILLAYGAVITIIAGFFGFHYFTSGDKSAHPYKAMPDVLRQYDPAKKPQVSFQGLPDPKLEIPQDLRVKLGGELVVGDLKVQPLFVEKKSFEATTKYVSDPDKIRQLKPTLVLTLRVKNNSPDITFCPNDPAFTRAVDLKQEQPAPYTALQIDNQYYYGIFKWPPDPGTEREFLVGHEADEQPLKPGEERDTWVAVAPSGTRAAGSTDIIGFVDDPKLRPDKGMLWRVQLRRGLMNMKDESGKEMEVSATTVIGVEFQAKDIK